MAVLWQGNIRTLVLMLLSRIGIAFLLNAVVPFQFREWRIAMDLETKRLYLQEFQSADFDDYFAYIMDPHLQEMLGLNNVFDRPSALENFNWLMENRQFIAVCKKENGRVIGHICVHPPLESVAKAQPYCSMQGASLSYALAAGEQRKGYMYEALSALCGYLRNNAQIDYLNGECLSSNFPSRRLLEKLGFQHWGLENFGGIELITVVRVL